MRWVSILFFLAAGLLQAQAEPFDISPRREINFSTGWLYLPDDAAGAEKTDFDDSRCERVSVPHANVLTPHETFDPDMFRFVSWYRKHFRTEAAWKGKKVYVRFQSVMTVATVYLNGSLLGVHKGGYTPFLLDLTPRLLSDEDNVLAVRVESRIQNEVPPEGAPKMFGFVHHGDAAYARARQPRQTLLIGWNPSASVRCRSRRSPPSVSGTLSRKFGARSGPTNRESGGGNEAG